MWHTSSLLWCAVSVVTSHAVMWCSGDRQCDWYGLRGANACHIDADTRMCRSVDIDDVWQTVCYHSGVILDSPTGSQLVQTVWMFLGIADHVDHLLFEWIHMFLSQTLLLHLNAKSDQSTTQHCLSNARTDFRLNFLITTADCDRWIDRHLDDS